MLGGQQRESGGRLALRALGRASLYSVGGCALLCAALWRAAGVADFGEFRERVGRALPRLTPTAAPTSRTEFAGVRDLFDYLIQEDQRKKSEKDDR